MAFGLSTLTTLYLILPAFLAAFFLLPNRAPVSSQALISNVTNALIFAIGLILILAHSVSIAVASIVASTSQIPPVDLRTIALFLAGLPGDEPGSHIAFELIVANWHWVIIYLVHTSIIAAFLATIARRIRVKSLNWFEQLLDDRVNEQYAETGHANSENEKIWVWITTLVDNDGGANLIEGFYDELIEEGGNIQALVLKNARRCRLADSDKARLKLQQQSQTDKNTGSNASNTNAQMDGWIRIPGEFFMIKFEHIHNFNVDLVWFSLKK